MRRRVRRPAVLAALTALRVPGVVRALGVLVLLGVLGVVLGVGPAGWSGRASAATRTADEPAATVTIRSVGPALVQRADEVVVGVTITNAGDRPLEAVAVRLRLLPERLGSREQVTAWSAAEETRDGVPVGDPADLPAPLAPDAATDITLRVPALSLGLDGREFGAYGIAVEVRATVDGVRDQVGLTRTTLQWQPTTKQYAAQRIAWLVPFTGLPGAGGPGKLTPDQVAAAVGPESRLRHLLDAASAPGVAWAVDPALLSTLAEVADQPAGAAPTPTSGPSTPSNGAPTSAPASPSAAQQVVRTYLDDLRAAAVGREVVELPYADPDVAALTRARAADLLTAARAVSAGVVEEVLGVVPRTDLAWPADGYASDAALRTWRAGGARSIVLDAASRPLADSLSYTVDARVALPQSLTGLLADPVLSGLLGDLSAEDATASARVLAETAAATTERPGLSRRLLVAAPRDLDPDPVAFRTLVATAAAVPWLRTVRVADLLTPADRADAATLERRVVPLPPDDARLGVTVRDVAVVRRLRADLSAIGEVVDTPSALTADAQRSTLELLSVAWRGSRSTLLARQRTLGAAFRSRTDGVRVLPSTVNFLVNEGRLQVTVSNELGQRVEGVRLQVTASSPKLQVERPTSERLSLEPGTRTRVQVPVRALASGLVSLQAQLITPSGARIGSPEQVEVRVRPTDSWLLTAVGVVVALAVLAGLVRSLRRPRRRAAAATASSTGSDTGPETATTDHPGDAP